MQQKNILFVLLFISIISSCHKREINKSNNGRESKTPLATTDSIKSVIINANYNIKDTGATYTIDSAKVNADILSLFIKYSGGCKAHSFDLYSTGFYAKALPPQTFVFLKHNSNGDACRQFFMKELKFNISQLKYTGQKVVVVKIGKKHRVQYTSK